ncbi:MAG TPA: type II toxin-antitoxin system VapC family toxin [Candidatus Nanoarchaeia archaeon]|nr:type II toxin-antitoxin system VapC family toxin [Candidatus Nanoarchaeia archaeon]
MERQKKIVDANIGVKWFSAEEKTEEARNLLKLHTDNNIDLIIPDLFLYEILNALNYKSDNKKDLNKVIDELQKFQLNVCKISNKLMEKIVEISIKYSLTIYDSTYLALAELLECELITLDKKILNTKHPLVVSL